jgi:hypothetical protein
MRKSKLTYLHVAERPRTKFSHLVIGNLLARISKGN